MTYRELTMMDVKELLRRWQAGQSERQIGKQTGTDRKTVGRYIHWAVEFNMPRDRELSDDEIHAVAQCVQTRRVPEASAGWEEVARHKGRIAGWLGAKRPLRLTKIHTLLVRDGLCTSYATLRRCAIQERGWGKRAPTVRLDDPPPVQEAQIDFGRMGYILDVETNRRRMLWALIVTLCFSRYQCQHRSDRAPVSPRSPGPGSGAIGGGLDLTRPAIRAG